MPGGFPKATSYPVNGFGGSYYNERFRGVPVYNEGQPGVNNNISWKAIDDYGLVIVNIIAIDSVCLGLCLAAFVYTISLTPREKRAKIFHISLLTALVLEIYRLLTVVAPASTPGISSFSSYLLITNDIRASSFSLGYYGATISGYFAGCLAYLFTVGCLYIQTKGLLAGFQLRHPKYYIAGVCYLLSISAIAFVTNVVFDAFQTARMFGKVRYYSGFVALHKTVLAFYAVSLGSWCLVSLVTVAILVFTRSDIVRGKTRYDTVLKILLLTLLDSFIVPCKCRPSSMVELKADRSIVIFCVLQAIPHNVGYLAQAEKLVLPSILILLPLGSLFMSVRSDHSESGTSKSLIHNQAAYSTLASNTTRETSDQMKTETNVHGHGFDGETCVLRSLPSTIGQHDRELSEIDKMPEEEVLVSEDETMEAITKQRAGMVMKNLAAKNVTSACSNDNIGRV